MFLQISYLKMVVVDFSLAIRHFLSHQEFPQGVVLGGGLCYILHFDLAVTATATRIGPVPGALVLSSLRFFGSHDDNSAVLLPHHLPEVSDGGRKTALGGYVDLAAGVAAQFGAYDVVRLPPDVVGVYVI